MWCPSRWYVMSFSVITFCQPSLRSLEIHSHYNRTMLRLNRARNRVEYLSQHAMLSSHSAYGHRWRRSLGHAVETSLFCTMTNTVDHLTQCLVKKWHCFDRIVTPRRLSRLARLTACAFSWEKLVTLSPCSSRSKIFHIVNFSCMVQICEVVYLRNCARETVEIGTLFLN